MRLRYHFDAFLGIRALMVAIGLIQSGPALAQTYEIVELGPFPEHTVGFAADINSSGVVTGHWSVGGTSFVSFVYEDGTLTYLDLGPQISGRPVSINDAGIIAGNWAIDEPSRTRAALWNNGVVTDLGTLGGTYSSALDLNNLGQVVGAATVAAFGDRHAFLWENGVMLDLNDLLPELPPWTLTFANKINDAGQIIGGGLEDGHARGFLMTTIPSVTFQDLGFSPGSINGHGEIVGSTDMRPILWKDGVISELGALGGGDGSATDINDAHQVVGLSMTQDVSTWHAFIWEEGVMRDLNDLIPADLGWELVSASAINDAGQIVATGLFEGVRTRFPLELYRPFLLSPCDDSDGDRICDSSDGCPNDPGKTQPGDCGCGIPDSDGDADGVLDCFDGCPDDPEKTAPATCGCGAVDGGDADSDGVLDCLDECPTDPDKTQAGACGCGMADTDGDEDGAPDCLDGCPDDPEKTEPGICGCGDVDGRDTDVDGVPDCLDECPIDPHKSQAGACGCGMADTDGDEDGTPDCLDECPIDPGKTGPGVCGCGVSDPEGSVSGASECGGSDDPPAQREGPLCGLGAFCPTILMFGVLSLLRACAFRHSPRD